MRPKFLASWGGYSLDITKEFYNAEALEATLDSAPAPLFPTKNLFPHR